MKNIKTESKREIEPPPKTIILSPKLQIYVERFGMSKDDETPSLAISLYNEYRGFGIGTALMKEILGCLRCMDMNVFLFLFKKPIMR